MRIVWDERKRLANIAKHGFDFADLSEAFFIDSAIVAVQHGRYMAVGRLLDGTIAIRLPRQRRHFGHLDAGCRRQGKGDADMIKPKIDKEFIAGKGFTREDWNAVDSPVLTDAQIAGARPFADIFPEAAAEIRRNLGGRPRSERPKRPVSIRFDQDVIDYFKAGGEGWQSRMNEALRKVAGL
jgi:uncharacterized protein (DUF4415 family)